MVRTLRAKLAILLATCLSFTSRTAMFVAPYDKTTDHLLTDLSVKTETAVAQADPGQLSQALAVAATAVNRAVGIVLL
jgi:hypothetical protein